jgi:transposase-like protein
MAKGNGTGVQAVAQAALTDDPAFLREIVERTVQALLETEMTAHLGAERYERSAERKGQRNGYKPRTLHTRVGALTLRIPQDRESTFSTQLFARYQRHEKALVLALMEMYVEGVSTRKVAEITEVLCGTSFSKSLVSHLAGELDTELAAWRARPLTDTTYPYLFVDARYEHVRVDGRIVSQGVLVVSAIRGDGRRELVAVDVADTESEATYQALFRDLKARGLSGVRLVTSDDHAGLGAAIARHFQGASWQRCQVHYTRNLLGLVGAGKRKELAAGLRQLFAASTPEQARTAAQDLATLWRATHPPIARALEEESEACFACLAFPLAHQARIRTTNGLERFHQELKRRTRVVRIFPNRAACLRLVTALCLEQSDEWVTGRRYLDLAELGGTDTPGTRPGRKEGAMQLVG